MQRPEVENHGVTRGGIYLTCCVVLPAETTTTSQASNPQYQTYHANNQYASMQPASLTSMGLRNFFPNALRGPSSVVSSPLLASSFLPTKYLLFSSLASMACG